MEEDLKREPQHRTGNIGMDFLEVYEHRIPIDQDYTPETRTPEPSPALVQKEKRKVADVEGIKTDDLEKTKKSSKIGKIPDEKKKKSVDILEPKKKKMKTYSNMSNIGSKGDNQTNEGVSTTFDSAIVNGDQAQERPSTEPKRLSAYEEYKVVLKEVGLHSNTDDNDDDDDGAEGLSTKDKVVKTSYLVDKQGSKSLRKVYNQILDVMHNFIFSFSLSMSSG
jgi:hypothetical protein